MSYLTNRGLPSLLLSGCQMIAAVALMLPTAIRRIHTPDRADRRRRQPADPRHHGTGLAYVLNHRIITDEGPTLASTLPVVAVALGFIALGEPVTIPMIAGILIVILGIALTRRPALPDHHGTGTS